jgi:hypothetical protein
MKLRSQAIGVVSLVAIGGIIIALSVKLARERYVALRKQRHEVTEQAIWNLVGNVQRIAATNTLPESDDQLQRILPDGLPLDGWGAPVHYWRFDSNRFSVSAMSPWPEVLVFEFDSVYSSNQIKKFLF